MLYRSTTGFTVYNFFKFEGRYYFGYLLTGAVVALNQSLYNFTEGRPPFIVCIDVVNGVSIEAGLALNVQAVVGTAGSTDFEALSRDVLVNGSTCVEVMILPDELLEAEEFFSILIGSRDPRLTTVPALSQTEIRIQDGNSKCS